MPTEYKKCSNAFSPDINCIKWHHSATITVLPFLFTNTVKHRTQSCALQTRHGRHVCLVLAHFKWHNCISQPTCDDFIFYFFAYLAQRIICGSIRKVQQKQKNPCSTDVDLFVALEMAVAVWAVIQWLYENTRSLLQKRQFLFHPIGTAHKFSVAGCRFAQRSRTLSLSFGDTTYNNFRAQH